MCSQMGRWQPWWLPGGKFKPATIVEPFYLNREPFQPFYLRREPFQHFYLRKEPFQLNIGPFYLSTDLFYLNMEPFQVNRDLFQLTLMSSPKMPSPRS